MTQRRIWQVGSVAILIVAILLLCSAFWREHTTTTRWIGVACVLIASWIVYYAQRRPS